MKTCSHCKAEKKESEFHKNTRICKTCKREFDRVHFQKVKDKRATYKERRRRENAQRLYEYLLGRKCEWEGCEVADPDMLTFDHLDRSAKRAGVPHLLAYSWASVLAEIKKCRILCANHHFKWTVEQMGWKKYLHTENPQSSEG